jgi:hypothetical protein
MNMDIEARIKNLRIFNLVMGFLHLAQGVVILVLTTGFALPINTAFLTFQPATRVLQPVIETLVKVPLGPLVAVFLLLSALAHFLIASPGIFPWYKKNIQKGINYARWYEYSISASLMVVLIGLLCGMYDLAALIMAFALTAVMNLCGLIMEVHNQTTQKTSWLSFNIGCIAGIVPWIAIAIYFFGSLSRPGGQAPAFVYAILPSLFVFFFTFALNMFLQYKKVGPWKDYLYGERVYIILSLVAKSLLAWQIFAGTLRPM